MASGTGNQHPACGARPAASAAGARLAGPMHGNTRMSTALRAMSSLRTSADVHRVLLQRRPLHPADATWYCYVEAAQVHTPPQARLPCSRRPATASRASAKRCCCLRGRPQGAAGASARSRSTPASSTPVYYPVSIEYAAASDSSRDTRDADPARGQKWSKTPFARGLRAIFHPNSARCAAAARLPSGGAGPQAGRSRCKVSAAGGWRAGRAHRAGWGTASSGRVRLALAARVGRERRKATRKQAPLGAFKTLSFAHVCAVDAGCRACGRPGRCGPARRRRRAWRWRLCSGDAAARARGGERERGGDSGRGGAQVRGGRACACHTGAREQR